MQSIDRHLPYLWLRQDLLNRGYGASIRNGLRPAGRAALGACSVTEKLRTGVRPCNLDKNEFQHCRYLRGPGAQLPVFDLPHSKKECTKHPEAICAGKIIPTELYQAGHACCGMAGGAPEAAS